MADVAEGESAGLHACKPQGQRGQSHAYATDNRWRARKLGRPFETGNMTPVEKYAYKYACILSFEAKELTLRRDGFIKSLRVSWLACRIYSLKYGLRAVRMVRIIIRFEREWRGLVSTERSDGASALDLICACTRCVRGARRKEEREKQTFPIMLMNLSLVIPNCIFGSGRSKAFAMIAI
jgi:hypothetical protein